MTAVPTAGSDGRRHLVSGASRLGVGTLLSRLLGLARDMARAWLFGTGMAADAFTVAFRIPNLLRALFAEGALSASLVPVLADYVERDDRAATERFLRSLSTVLCAALGVTVLAGILLAPVVVPWLVHGFREVPGKVELTIRLTQILFPYLFLIGLATLAMAVLNTYRHFTAPALSPSLLNVAMIAGALLIAPRLGADPSVQVYGLAGAVLVGGALQTLIQWPPLRSRGLSLAPSGRWTDPGVGRVLWLMLPGVLGIAVQEINAFVDTFLGSLLAPGSVSALEYGQRVMQLPLGVIGVALGTASLPTLSRLISRGERAEAEDTAAFSIRLVTLVMLPASLWLWMLARPILALLFQRGAFTGGDSLALTAMALRYYAVGLVAYGTAKSLVPLFYAHKDTRTPVRAAIASLAANIVLNLILMRFLALGGLALATALSSFLNVGLLARFAWTRLGLRPLRGLLPAVARLVPALLLSVAVIAAVQRIPGIARAEGVGGRAVQALVPLAAGALSYALALHWLRSPEWIYLGSIVRGRLRRG